MNHQVHYKLAHQQSANVPAGKMLSYVNQSSQLIAPDERFDDDWTFPTDRGSNAVRAADDDVARVELSFLLFSPESSHFSLAALTASMLTRQRTETRDSIFSLIFFFLFWVVR